MLSNWPKVTQLVNALSPKPTSDSCSWLFPLSPSRLPKVNMWKAGSPVLQGLRRGPEKQPSLRVSVQAADELSPIKTS